MESAIRFLFNQRDTGISIATSQVARDIQADDAAADYEEITLPCPMSHPSRLLPEIAELDYTVRAQRISE
jgi:hypothetical protein